MILTRRRLLEFGAGGAMTAWLRQPGRGGSSRLRARPDAPSTSVTPGEHALELEKDRDGLLRVPGKYRPDTPAPLALLLHGAGGRARRVVSLLGVAESLGVVVLAPESREGTWDAIRGDFGRDVEFVDRALEHTFARCNIDRRRLAIGGFSDGASYALSLGLDNGDLFTHILAFSPGFIVSGSSPDRRASRGPQGGRPRVFVSHGRQDEILPIAQTSRRLVPALENGGYAVTYREFEGPHTVPPDIAREGFLWFAR